MEAGTVLQGALRVLRLPLVAGLLILAISSRVGWTARYVVIEPDDLYGICLPDVRPWWCAPRDTLIFVTYAFSFGYASVAAALLAWWCRPRAASMFAMVALASGGIGLYLYQTTWSALGVLLALLRLPRLPHHLSQAGKLSA
jgi:hypothetical protein